MFTNKLKKGLQLRPRVEKSVHGIGRKWSSGKEKVPGAAVSKGGDTSETWKDPSLLIALKDVQQ